MDYFKVKCIRIAQYIIMVIGSVVQLVILASVFSETANRLLGAGHSILTYIVTLKSHFKVIKSSWWIVCFWIFCLLYRI